MMHLFYDGTGSPVAGDDGSGKVAQVGGGRLELESGAPEITSGSEETMMPGELSSSGLATTGLTGEGAELCPE